MQFWLASVAFWRLHLHTLSEALLDMPDRFVRFLTFVADQHKYSIRVTAILFLSQQDGGHSNAVFFSYVHKVLRLYNLRTKMKILRELGKGIFVYKSSDRQSPYLYIFSSKIIYRLCISFCAKYYVYPCNDRLEYKG